jgi:hypothetical protein
LLGDVAPVFNVYADEEELVEEAAADALVRQAGERGARDDKRLNGRSDYNCVMECVGIDFF